MQRDDVIAGAGDPELEKLNTQLHSLRRVALAVAHPGGESFFDDLVRELADALGVAAVFVAVFADHTHAVMRTLAARLDGRALKNFDYPLDGSPCRHVVGRDFRYVGQGVAAEFRPGPTFGAEGMDSYAAYPLLDSGGQRLGLLVAMDRHPIAGGDPAHAEAMLKIVAGRLAAEMERSRTDEAWRSAALAVSAARGDTVFDQLVRLLATILDVEVAFIARHDADDPQGLRMLAMYYDGEILRDIRYAIAGTPCSMVLGRCFQAYPRNLQALFPDDDDARMQRTESYAGYPLAALDGTPLGIVSIASRRPLLQVGRVESMLKVFAVRAAAEVERLRANEALQRSEASHRAIFEAAEDAIFIHDWDTGAIVDVNRKACETFGYTSEEMRHLHLSDVSSGEPPYTAGEALRYIQLAKEGHCPPFEWHCRNKDGSLHWDEVRLKAAMIGGRPHVLAFTRDITERKLAEEALRLREGQYRAVFEGSADALGVWSRDMRMVDVNSAFTRMYGYTREEVVGRGFGQKLAPEDVQRRVEMIERALAGEEGTLETHLRRKNGEEFEVELRYLPIMHRGEPHVLVIGRDITVRRRADQALRDSEAQYRAIFNASADALVLRAADFSIVDVNATYEAMSGYARHEVLGVSRVLANPPEVADVIRGLHDRVLAGEPIALQTPFVRRDGERYDIELRGVPIRHRGEPHVLYIGRDITKARRAELALRASEEQYRAIFNASADALILRDAGFRAVEVNPAYSALSGYSRAELLSSPRVLMSENEDAVHRSYLEDHARILAGEDLRFERTARRKDGQRRQVEVRGTSVSYRGELHVLYAVRDISERHASELQRTELEAQLRQAQKMEAIGQLTGGIAHDFNNILTSVIGYQVLGMERAEALGDAALLRQLGQANLAAQRARDLIGQMLAFARRQRGERRVLALAPLLRQSVQLLRATLPSSIVLDATELDTHAQACAAAVEADMVQLEQVIFNLCINARDAMGGAGHIRISLHEVAGGGWCCASCGSRIAAGRWVELSVNDSGAGVPPEVMERMFEPFYSTKEVGRGSGMGLAMVHGIVHDHGGHVRVDTRPGGGTTFRVLLPAVRAGAAAEVPALEPAEAAAFAPLGGRVL
ncbi:PAS domain S-box protein, partial [Piscinibacter sp.]|uniref:PAS domain S-box protein n=1 Tax=Piscinibacter sp. TaxID=1903157 RepID=UPI002C095223